MNSYRKLCTRFYDVDKPHAPPDALEFYLHYARQANGPIFEPMCGSGRFLLPLLEQGFQVDGLDASSEMLQACRATAAQGGLAPVLYEQFLHEMEVPGRYNLVIIPAGSFGLITDLEQARESLRRLHTVMLPGSYFVLEIDQLLPTPPQDGPWGGRWVTCPDGSRIVISWLGHFDPVERVQHSIHRYDHFKNGKLLETEWEEFDLRYYDPAEFKGLLEEAGFGSVCQFKQFEWNPPGENDESIVFECVRL